MQGISGVPHVVHVIIPDNVVVRRISNHDAVILAYVGALHAAINDFTVLDRDMVAVPYR